MVVVGCLGLRSVHDVERTCACEMSAIIYCIVYTVYYIYLLYIFDTSAMFLKIFVHAGARARLTDEYCFRSRYALRALWCCDVM